jgi:hypothetical protein
LADDVTTTQAQGHAAGAPGGSRVRARDSESFQLRVMVDLMWVWDRLAAGALPRRVCGELMQRSDCSRHTAQRYVAAALRVLQRDQANEPIESKRARILAMAQAGYEQAMSRERGFVVQTGANTQAIEKVPDPDAKGAAMHLAIIARIELGV